MKVFIVFMALLIVNITFMVYQSDAGKYERIQNFLKATAEECAAGAALYYDESFYGDGELVFNYKSGEEYIDYLLQGIRTSSPMENDTKITYQLVYEDDYTGYRKEEIPSVTVTLKASSKDIFRLPFLTVKEVTRRAKYELPID